MVVDLNYGWRRRLDAGLIIGIALIAGWFVFGNAGAALLGLWSLQFWPRRRGERVVIEPEGIRWARLHHGRVVFAEGFHVQSVFRGEISDRDYSAICRLLKNELRSSHLPE